MQDAFKPLDDMIEQEIEDCLDWLASTLARTFPGLGLEPYDATEWRRGLRIAIPAQADFSVHEVETKAHEWRDKLFFEKSILIALTVMRDRSEE